MRRSTTLFGHERFLIGAIVVTGACRPAVTDLPGQVPIACPRAARIDAQRRCTCDREQTLLLGACVPAAAADAYCGPAGIARPFGCELRDCAAGERLDISTGRCEPEGGAAQTCSDDTLPIFSFGSTFCAQPDATCPRGTLRAKNACLRPPECPAGAIFDGQACRAISTKGAEGAVVDVGAWSAIALGIDGGPGSEPICGPLLQVPSLFAHGGSLQIRVTVQVPDQDLTQLYTEVEVHEGHESPDREPTGLIADEVDRSVSTLFELLRSMGGTATTATWVTTVTCTLGPTRPPTKP